MSMLHRRTITAMLAGAVVVPGSLPVRAKRGKVTFYSSVGASLNWYQVDIDGVALSKQGSVALPALVQYAWRHPLQTVLYVASSNFVPMDKPGGKHNATAFRIDPASGALTPHGDAVALRARPINITVDKFGRYLLIAYNVPSSISVHRINGDGALGEEVKQAAALDCGIYAHQVRVMPDNKAMILVTRGNNAANGKPEDPGALKVKSFNDGQLADIASIAPNNGYGFGPRHLDFHPARPWVFVSLERENQLDVYRMRADNLDPKPIFSKTTLSEPNKFGPDQMVGPIHVHPNGRFVYLGNRNSGVTDYQGKKVAVGGENGIAVFAIDQHTGEPTLLQNIPTHGFHPRTFSLDPSGRMLVVANLTALPVRDGDAVKTQPATLSAYRVGNDGKLSFARAYDIETGTDTQFWSGMVAL
jgi:6-phosphogluconolactonase